ncbi:hypothetical protein DE146DRAFT_744997 [Phaeosphaeria sp. MPI-PUGE-AT-0046c]|nr:hypothetical protein DE146DRAFT_744997 [Phaeosphaeria sp. MPI-PUGE-AT-0046c]
MAGSLCGVILTAGLFYTPSPHWRTNIISDLDAIALAQQSPRKAHKKSKKYTTCLSNPSKAGSSKTVSSKKSGGKQDARNPAGDSKSKPAKKTAEQVTSSQYYQRYGVQIPLYERGGKKRAHARLAKALRNKGTDVLLNIVQEYAGVEKRKEFKNSNITEAEIADWIEEVETRALGPNPRSTLKIVKDASVVKKENVPIAELEAVPEPVKYEGKGKASLHTATQDEGKRKCDDTSEPLRGSQQTTKKSKTRHADTQLAEQSPTEDTILNTDASTKDEYRKSRGRKPDSREAEKLTKLKPGMEEENTNQHTEEYKQLEQTARLGKFMKQVDIDMNNPDASSKFVVLHEQDEVHILTASTAQTTGKIFLHDTAVPLDVDGAKARLRQLLSTRPVETPFLKAGQHGRHGDFVDDPDRRTGRGHQLALKEKVALDRYLQSRGQALKQFPRYSAVTEGQKTRLDIEESWEQNELWYNKFTIRYPGFSVNHLWPCGCEKLRGESESGESEEE